MADFYAHPIRRPRTIDRLEIFDCIEIIVADLARYGVPDSAAMEIVTEYFVPLKRVTDKLKREYGEVCFKNSSYKVFKD